MTRPSSRLASLAAVLAVPALGLGHVPAMAASGHVGALTVARSTSSPNDLNVSWDGSSTGNYTLSVAADGVVDTSTVNGTSATVEGRTLQTVYKVTVSGSSGGSQTKVVAPALPGAVGDLYGVPADGGGITLTWSAPDRDGRLPVSDYRVRVKDLDDGTETDTTTTGQTLTLPTVDHLHRLRVTVEARTADGAGIAATAAMGGETAGAPQGFTAVREPGTPTGVDLTWEPPAWRGTSPVTGYEVRGLDPSPTTWVPVGAVLTYPTTLPATSRRIYSVRAVNATGPSAADSDTVDVLRRTLTPDAGSPVVLTHHNHTVDVAMYGWLGDDAEDQLLVRIARTNGKDTFEQVVEEDEETGVSFENLTNGRWIVTVLGIHRDTGALREVFAGGITVDNDPNGEVTSNTTFEGELGYWVGVHPTRHRPRVVSTSAVAFDGTSAMAITSTWDLRRSNVTAGTGGRGGIPVNARQRVLAVAQGRATVASSWTIGVSWWDAQGKRLGVSRSKRAAGVIGAWAPSTAAVTAPANAVKATVFIEVGGLNRGNTFYVDGVTLTSR